MPPKGSLVDVDGCRKLPKSLAAQSAERRTDYHGNGGKIAVKLSPKLEISAAGHITIRRRVKKNTPGAERLRGGGRGRGAVWPMGGEASPKMPTGRATGKRVSADPLSEARRANTPGAAAELLTAVRRLVRRPSKNNLRSVYILCLMGQAEKGRRWRRALRPFQI